MLQHLQLIKPKKKIYKIDYYLQNCNFAFLFILGSKIYINGEQIITLLLALTSLVYQAYGFEIGQQTSRVIDRGYYMPGGDTKFLFECCAHS